MGIYTPNMLIYCAALIIAKLVEREMTAILLTSRDKNGQTYYWQSKSTSLDTRVVIEKASVKAASRTEPSCRMY